MHYEKSIQKAFFRAKKITAQCCTVVAPHIKVQRWHERKLFSCSTKRPDATFSAVLSPQKMERGLQRQQPPPAVCTYTFIQCAVFHKPFVFAHKNPLSLTFLQPKESPGVWNSLSLRRKENKRETRLLLLLLGGKFTTESLITAICQE